MIFLTIDLVTITMKTRPTTLKMKKLLKVYRAAKDLEQFLFNNSGNTADWPIRLKADPDYVAPLAKKLNLIKDTVNEYETLCQHK